MAQLEEVGFLWLILIGTAVIFLLTLAIILFVIFYQRKLFNQKINIQELKHTHQKKLLVAALEAQEKERNRIAQDLHDEVGCVLSTIKLYVSQVRTHELEDSVEQLVDQSGLILDEAIGKLRSISHDLVPTALEKFGLVRVLEREAEQINKAGAIKVELKYNREHRLPANQEVHLYRIVNELMNNTIKHAEASAILVRLVFDPHTWRLDYKDNGIGLDWNDEKYLSPEIGGFGFKTIASRVEMLAAEAKVTSKKEGGLEFEIKGSY
jgi:signal transduction histidine kinase